MPSKCLKRQPLPGHDSFDMVKEESKSTKMNRPNVNSPSCKKKSLYPSLGDAQTDDKEELDTTGDGDLNDSSIDNTDSGQQKPKERNKPNSRKASKEHHDMSGDSQSGQSFLFSFILILGVMLIAVGICWFLHLLTERVEEKVDNVRSFRQKFANIKKRYPSQNSRFWKVIDSQLRRVLSAENPDYPAILLVGVPHTGTVTALCLGKQLVQTVNSVFKLGSNSYINAVELSGSTPAKIKLKLDRSLQEQLKAGKGVVLDHIEELPAEGALLLHGYCDGDNAPFKQAVIVLLFHTDDEYTSLDHKTFEDKLTELWEADLGHDEMPALRSRVANNVVIVKPEANISC